jgi:hypothetical protein
LFGWLRDLFRPRQPQVEDAVEVAFRADARTRQRQEAERMNSKVA